MIFPVAVVKGFSSKTFRIKILRRPARRGSTSDGRTGFENERKRTVNGPASGRGCGGHKLRGRHGVGGLVGWAHGRRYNTGKSFSRFRHADARRAQEFVCWRARCSGRAVWEVASSHRDSCLHGSGSVRIAGGCCRELTQGVRTCAARSSLVLPACRLEAGCEEKQSNVERNLYIQHAP